MKPLPLHDLPLVLGGRFTCKVPISFETDKFLVKTVENSQELKRALKLRYEVFYEEVIDRAKFIRIDRDKFDPKADHLVVIEKSTGDTVATYRLLCSTYAKHFYSATEFDMDAILALPGDKVELGRACVRKDYRKGIMVILLWRAIALYLKVTGSRYLFGCSSIKTLSVPEIAKVHSILMRSHAAPIDTRVYPLPKYRIRNFDEYLAPWSNVDLVEPRRAIQDILPPLVHLYLDVGGMICGEPALDKSFKCADLFTLLDSENTPPAVRKRYGF